MKEKIYCPDIECESCVKILAKVFKELQGIENFDIKKEHIGVDYDQNLIRIDSIIQAIKDKGYRASLQPYTRKNIKDRAKEFLKDKKKYQIEYQMLRYIGVAFLILLVLDALLLYIKSLSDPTFIGKYVWWIFYLTLSIVTLAGALWHYKAYRTNHTCMVGMMIGMTIGMQFGMMIGAVIGITNGFFMGAMVGMIGGSIFGAYAGNCCGIMGIMEGIMAGLMGGTMGAMITVMMYNENILWFMPLYMLLNIIVLAGLSYMIFEEVVEDNMTVVKKPMNFSKYVMMCITAKVILTGIILYYPASIFLV